MTVLQRSHLSDLHVRDDGRTLEGTAVPYGQEADIREYGRRYIETFIRGAFTDVDPAVGAAHRHPPAPRRRAAHRRDRRARGRADGAPRRLACQSETELGNEVLALAHDRVPLALSVGFVEVAGGSRWNNNRTRVERTKAELDHVAVVRRGAYPGALVTAVRGAQGLSVPRLRIARLRSGER